MRRCLPITAQLAGLFAASTATGNPSWGGDYDVINAQAVPVATWGDVPPDTGRPIAINTNTDDAKQAVWTTDTTGQFRGILIDIVGTNDSGTFIDTQLISKK